ncbi:SusC/RagA family TonB-linked outer membrane protein, partial [Parabacteroides sp. OttesenSCG-928-K15]|nr:SusC/RagA family TonB-linked outer membrane protein [Parabacteroides sp. OttesenSCG-928-K15]
LTYNKRFFPNDFGAGYGGGGYLYNLVVWTGTEIDIRDYKNYWVKEHEDQNWMDKNWYDNPYYIANEIVRNQHYDLTNGHLNAAYDITPWLKATLRSGLDTYTQKEEWKNPVGSSGGWGKKGYYAFQRTSGYSINNDAMLMADKTFGNFAIDGLAGGSIFYYMYDRILSETQNGLTIPGFYSLNASVDPVKSSKSHYRRQMNSLYGKLSLAWRSAVFLDATARNDWSSTLEQGARSYFYPSFAGSIVMSEFILMPEFIGFWKLRGSWTQTKQDLGIYETNATYNISTNVWEGLNASSYPTTIRGALVLPSATRSWEIGTAFSFLDNRLRLDATYYNKLYYNLTRQASVSPTSGFLNTLINIGEEQLRKGVEVTISADPIKTKDFSWNTTFNWSLDRYYYDKVDDTYSTQKPWVAAGKRWDWMSARDYERDPAGNIVHLNGYPVISKYDSMQGYTEPDWIFGWSNTLRYKDFSLNFTIDGRVGGILFSTMDQAMWNSGSHIDSDTQWRYDEVVNGNITYIGEGVKVVSGSADYDAYGNITRDDRVFAPNDETVSYEAYMKYKNPYIGTVRTQNIFNQTYFKLRNLAINYNCPRHIAEKIGMKGASIGFVGQNLLVWTKELRFVDPDRSSDNLNAPSVRYMGVNLKLDF